MTPPHGPAEAGPAALDAVVRAVGLAEADNGEARPERARRRLLAALTSLDGLDPTNRDAAVVRVRTRALTELAKSEAETGTRARTAAERIDELLSSGAGAVWSGLQPAVD